MNGSEDIKKLRDQYKQQTGIDPAIITVYTVDNKVIPSYTEFLEHLCLSQKYIIDDIKKDKGN